MKSLRNSFRDFCEVMGFDGSTKNIVMSFVVVFAMLFILGCAECVASWIETL